MPYDQAQVLQHYHNCVECNCSAGRAEVIVHLTKLDNARARQQEFTLPPGAVLPYPSGFDTPTPEHRLTTAEAYGDCTIYNEVPGGLQNVPVSSPGSWWTQALQNLLGCASQFRDNEPPVEKSEGDCLRV